ncbi:MAG: hypothetical protein A3K76_00485 [Euryarchaeota archaeon RBG_13_57_23]|nr:MAG: hypothetical protein A3K76_00485 [Euryarchaeota archaeon RBG_13_57_23]
MHGVRRFLRGVITGCDVNRCLRGDVLARRQNAEATGFLEDSTAFIYSLAFDSIAIKERA